MLAKIIVTGATREQALERSRRVLDETVIEGIATVLPFHRAVVRDAAFTSEPFTVHTRWIETEWVNEVPPFGVPATDGGEAAERETVVVEVGGRRIEVRLPKSLLSGTTGAPSPQKRSSRPRGGATAVAASGASLTAPMQGTIVKVAAQNGDRVNEGDVIVVVEAMKMEQPLPAHKAGTVAGLSLEVGATVTAGAVVCTIDD